MTEREYFSKNLKCSSKNLFKNCLDEIYAHFDETSNKFMRYFQINFTLNKYDSRKVAFSNSQSGISFDNKISVTMKEKRTIRQSI